MVDFLWKATTCRGIELVQLIISFAFLVLAVLSLRGMRWAYIAFVLLGLLYFPARVGFRLDPQPCELALNIPLAIHSLTNYGHIVRFALFFVMTWAQFRGRGWSVFTWTLLATMAMGVLVELAEGVSGRGHCRLRDLIPDAVGALLGQVIVFVWNSVRMRSRLD